MLLLITSHRRKELGFKPRSCVTPDHVAVSWEGPLAPGARGRQPVLALFRFGLHEAQD